MFIQSLNLYRGLAIILVVAGHTYSLAYLQFDTFVERLFASFVTGATTIFVFISGFLFHHIFYRKYVYGEFVKSKALNILIPYFLISTPVILLTIVTGRNFSTFFDPTGSGVFNEWIVPYLKYIVTGRVLTAYWYVPFIFVMFICAPLHVAFIRSRGGVQIACILVTYAVSALIHRPVSNLNPIHNVAYAMGPYLLGIWCSINKEELYRKLTGKEWLFMVAAAAIAVAQASLGLFTNFHKAAFAWGGVDLMLFQKAFLSLFFFIFLHRFEHIRINWLEKVSAVSFAIFFLHPLFIRLILEAKQRLKLPGAGWDFYVVVTVAILVACTLIALGMKRALGKNSRYFIGY